MGYVLTPHPAGHIADIGEVVAATSQVSPIRATRDPWRGQPPIGAPFTMNRDSPQSDGLVFWLPMLGQDAGAQRFVDRANGVALTPYNGPVWTSDGWLGNALLFDDGSNEYLEIDVAPISGYPLTMSAWFWSNDATIRQTLINVSDKDVETDQFALFADGQTGGDPVGFAAIQPGQGQVAWSSTGYSLNTWHHACGVGISSVLRYGYIDGGSRGSQTTNITPSSLDRVSIGRSGDSSPSYYHSGAIADARIYNRALSDAEVAQLYDPQTRWELYQPERRFWSGWSEPEIQVDKNVAHNVRSLHGAWGVNPPIAEPFTMNRDSPQSDGLVFWLPMLGQDAGAQRFVDRANGVALTPYNSPVWTSDGWLGEVLSFDRDSSQYLLYTDGIVTAPPFTLSMSARMDTATSTAHTIMSLGNSTSSSDYYALYFRPDNDPDDISFYANDGVARAAEAEGTLNVGQWYGVAGVAASATSRTIYRDGIPGQENTASCSPSGIDRTAIAVRYTTSPASPGDVTVADVRVYNRALSDAEVRQMYAPETRWELYKPTKKLWTGWSAPQDNVEPRVLVSRSSWDVSRPPLGIEIDINWDSPQAKGLVFWLPMLGNEAGTNRFVDKVGGIELTPYNSPVWTSDGWLGSALLFDDGSSEYLITGSHSLPNYPFAMTVWFCSDDIDNNQTVLSMGDADGSDFFAIRLRGGVAGDYISIDATGGTTADTTNPYLLNTWHHACAICEAVDSRSIQIDGSGKGTASDSDTVSDWDRIAIGTTADVSPYWYMSGLIADVRVYNRALSDAEVAQMYDPKTRWDLYKFRVQVGYSEIVEVTVGELPEGVTIPVLLHHLRQQRIAG